jgi:hypothetical protein
MTREDPAHNCHPFGPLVGKMRATSTCLGLDLDFIRLIVSIVIASHFVGLYVLYCIVR